ncbi:MAG TPA: calcium/proton exchanger [Blastocatellia bacterium]|nr:calcium/proton exchanger [Blastocatellia bacterium]
MKKKSPFNQFLLEHALDVLLIFIPIAAVLHYSHAPEFWTFIASGLAIIPLAGWMGKATESLAGRLGAGIGGLLNATFGNAAEMIIAFQGLRAGLTEVVKASLTGSILGNILLVLGASMLAGGLKHQKQRFNRTAATMSATVMALSAIGLLVPALFHWVTRGGSGPAEKNISLEISIVLFVTYVLSLVFALRTHKDLYLGSAHDAEQATAMQPKTAGAVLLGATALVAWMSELLVHAVEPASKTLGLTEVFVGVIAVAIIGNAAEHSSAVLVAMKNQMDLAYHIAVGSSMQIALFVAPVLVFLSYAIRSPMDLLFTTFEVITVGLAVAVVSLVAADGETNWMEGVLLLAVYIIFAIAFFYLPASSGAIEAMDGLVTRAR